MAVTTRRREEPRAQQAGGIGQFLRDVYDELRKVVWPTRQETLQTTLVIIVVVIVLSLLLGLIDVFLKWSILDHLLKLGR